MISIFKIFIRKLLDSIVVNKLLLLGFITKRRFFSNKLFNIIQYSQRDSHIFFGYYDISPFSNNDKYLLAQKIGINNRPQRKNDNLSVGYFKIKDSKNFIELGKTNTWNWQQGSRLQWYPRDDSSKIFYNKIVDKNYGGVIQDINSKQIIKLFQFPLYDINSKGTYGLSLNFARLGSLRPGYGYNPIGKNISYNKEPDDDGIWVCNLRSGKKRLVLSIRQIANIKRLESMNDADHYFNHLSFNPIGNRFLFLHLWDTKVRRFARLITSNLNGKEINILNNSGHTSHYTWKDDQHILSFSTDEFGIQYYIYNDITEKKNIFANGIIKHDSHPSFSNNKERLLFDCYPNRMNEQNLFLYSYIDHKIHKIASFYNAYGYKGEVRCDLHPRWNYNNTKICCDSSNHKGYRSMYIIKE